MRKLVLAGLVVLALAGCVPAPPTAAPSPSATATATTRATPTPTPTPTPTRPALDELVLSPGGFEQLPLGIDPATIDPAVAIVEPIPLECDPSTLDWRAVEGAYPTDENGHPPFWIAVRDSRVTGIQVAYGPDIKTAEGIAIGSTRQELLEAYPGLEITLSDPRGDVYILQDDRGWMRMSVFYDTETVSEMLATTNDVQFFAPTFHPIGASCL